MPKRSDEHMAARRRQILDAALRCFVERGFHRTSILDICKAADLSVGAVYTHFKSKRMITLALGDLSAEWSAGLNFETLQEIREFLLDALRSYDHAQRAAGARVDFQLFQLGLHDKKLGERMRRALPAVEQLLLRTFKHLKERGDIVPEYDIENGARLLSAVMNSVWLSKAIDPQSSAMPYQGCVISEFNRMTPRATQRASPRRRSTTGPRANRTAP